jgi:hypothetical protein
VIHSLDDQIARAAQEHAADAPQRSSAVTLRGVRGLPSGKLAEIVAAAWREQPARLPDDAVELDRLFSVAFEDGLAAIGLCAAAVADAPRDALELALDWAERTDDVATADAIGWLVLGPAVAMAWASGPQSPGSAARALGPVESRLFRHRRPEPRRAAVAMGLAFVPERLEGPAAAALREKLGERQLQMVDTPQIELLAALLGRFVRDDSPAVQKVSRRIVRAWGASEPASLVRWSGNVPGGLPKLLGDEVKRVKRALERDA